MKNNSKMKEQHFSHYKFTGIIPDTKGLAEFQTYPRSYGCRVYLQKYRSNENEGTTVLTTFLPFNVY